MHVQCSLVHTMHLLTRWLRHQGRVFFSRDVVWGGGGGGIAFVGREKCEKYPKNKRNLLLFGGEIRNLGGGNSPPKGPEKNTASRGLSFQNVGNQS